MSFSDADRRCLFFGAGRWGRNVIDAFADCGAVPSGFLVSGSAATREWLTSRFPAVPVSHCPQRLLADDNASTVVIATPSRTHAELAELALSRGRHVFVEKPMALNSSDGQRLAAMAEDRGLALFTGFVYLYHPAFARLRTAVRPSEVASLHFTWCRPALVGPVEWELLPHELALAISLTGEVPGSMAIAGGGGRARCEWVLSNGGSVHIELDGCGPGPKEKRVRLETVSGARWEWIGDRLSEPRRSGPASRASEPELRLGTPKPLAREVRWFLDRRADRSAMRADMALSVAVVDLISCALTKREEHFA